ncbi:hypothetical protein [Chamaesiphon polymorphus]|uniref:hypothetical protein n=1 Tax=Chamaesiphon polymorphus TaxID=2107691 RepID=UPI0011B21DAB|nr:hypothetical protein [Chamaesiphon polymorphus]
MWQSSGATSAYALAQRCSFHVAKDEAMPVLSRCLVQHMRREPPRGCIRFLRRVSRRSRSVCVAETRDATAGCANANK